MDSKQNKKLQGGDAVLFQNAIHWLSGCDQMALC